MWLPKFEFLHTLFITDMMICPLLLGVKRYKVIVSLLVQKWSFLLHTVRLSPEMLARISV